MSDEKTDKPDLGGLVIPPGSSQDSISGASTISSSASSEVIKERKERSDKGKPRGDRQARASGGLPPLSHTQFAALYDPKVWGKVTTAPANAAAFITGKKYWQPSPEEQDTLGTTCSVAAQCFAVTDPRWLAASLALIAIADFYAIRLTMHFADKKKEEQENKDKK